MGEWLNIGCGTWRAPAPWVNVDVVDNDEVHPDVLRVPGEPLPFGDGTAERVFCGHVLEHMAWPELPAFLTDVVRVLGPGGELLVVGPDVYRTLYRWRDGTEPWEIVQAVLEQTGNYGFATPDLWPNARHWWNCDEERVSRLLDGLGLFTKVEAIPAPARIYDRDGIPGWPVVGFAPWQCAVMATV